MINKKFMDVFCKFKTKTNPYINVIRAKNQIGTYLLFFPCSWSTGLNTTILINSQKNK